MKKMKKIISILLAMVMIFAMSVTAFAEEEPRTTYTITITNESAGYVYEAYQVFSGDIHEGVLSNIQWGSGVKSGSFLTALKEDPTIGSKFTNCTTAAAVAEVMETQDMMTAEDMKIFADIVGNHLGTAEANTGEDKRSPYTITVNQGYYLIKNSEVPEENSAYTDFVLKVSQNTAIDPKTDIPFVEKKVKENHKYDQVDSDLYGRGYNDVADYNINDEVPFKLIGHLPNNYADYSVYKYVFHDTMASGFSYNGDTQVFIVNGASSFEVTSFFKTTEDNGILTVSCDNLKAIDGVTLDASSKVVVNYTAKLGTNAQIGCLGNKNEVYLEYSNDPTSAGEGTTAKTPKDQVIVFTYELDVTKVDGADSAKKLEGAEFKLCVKGTDLWAVVDENGYVTGWKNDKNLVPPLVSAADGTFKIIGLDDGEYQLKETKAPNGYNLLPDSVPLVIKGTTANGQNWNGSDETLTALTIKVGNSDVADGSVETGIVSAQIQNNKGATLPETGGVGTTMFYIVGALLVIGGGVFLVTRRRMKNEQ